MARCQRHRGGRARPAADAGAARLRSCDRAIHERRVPSGRRGAGLGARHLDRRAHPRRPPPRAGARPPARLPRAGDEPGCVCGLLVQPADVGRCPPAAQERERACDDLVLDAGMRGADYAQHLLDIARTVDARRSLSAAALAMARPSELEGRLLAILDGRHARRFSGSRMTWRAAAAIAAIVVPIASVQPVAREAQSLPPVASPALETMAAATAMQATPVPTPTPTPTPTPRMGSPVAIAVSDAQIGAAVGSVVAVPARSRRAWPKP